MLELGSIFSTICSSHGKRFLDWPPDVFGICSYVAKISGCYAAYAQQPSWVSGIGGEARACGPEWREVLDSGGKLRSNSPVDQAWSEVCELADKRLSDLLKKRKFVRSLLFLIAAADEACEGIGIPGQKNLAKFELPAELHLSRTGSLCKQVPTDILRVLPRQHTPQSGLNIRSLSHHLALCSASEVKTEWVQAPLVRGRRNKAAVNVLVAPWPLRLDASAITPAPIGSHNAIEVGYFDYQPSGSDAVRPVRDWLNRLLSKSRQIGQHVDLVVFPECALSEKQWSSVARLCSEKGLSVIAGVYGRRGNRATNTVRFSLPLLGQELIQHKHHRWRIDATQIRNYGLGGRLLTSKIWWENTHIEERKVQFLCVDPDLTITALICEDLARQDPVAEIIRSVGPNLVVSLLMDGPQINGRWASRYASVLADDPGSSVLTVTGLGVCSLSRPSGMQASRVIASWKDATGSYEEIALGPRDEAVILNLQPKTTKEWTVDGRHDGESATYQVLCGVHPIEC